MITHYGLFWSERDVFWGKPRKSGQLLGREKTPLGRQGAPTKAERQNFIDYRDYVGLYCLYGDGGLIYIGEAGIETKSTIYERLKRHRTGPISGRWDSFSWFGRSECAGSIDVSIALRQMEAISISIINPGFNKQNGAFAGATQVFQVPHDDAEGNLETKLARLSQQILDFQTNASPT
ncbi:MAG: hypothetical protein JJU26_08110 [Oceanicaulis sp.]|uniref:hypothetical protein n=1 Tax=Glycocaulis sp. TaxID=1969725 RepID=UPI0025C6ED8F|nr:hypothetical protein [Glycocaulis sp.]MCC5981666.1 hypothetical protein [Oceanicaulis sp.]MCH8520500.1 hypothetical protein [Glycocaulis sp.]